MSIIYDPEYKMLIDCLRESRYRYHFTQKELATCLGCSQAYISKYEQGQKRLDVIEIRRICLCLGISLSELINEFEERLLIGGM